MGVSHAGFRFTERHQKSRGHRDINSCLFPTLQAPTQDLRAQEKGLKVPKNKQAFLLRNLSSLHCPGASKKKGSKLPSESQNQKEPDSGPAPLGARKGPQLSSPETLRIQLMFSVADFQRGQGAR